MSDHPSKKGSRRNSKAIKSIEDKIAKDISDIANKKIQDISDNVDETRRTAHMSSKRRFSL